MFAPVITFEPEFAAGVQADWLFQIEGWDKPDKPRAARVSRVNAFLVNRPRASPRVRKQCQHCRRSRRRSHVAADAALRVSHERSHHEPDLEIVATGAIQQSTAGRAAGARRLPLRLREQPRQRRTTTLLVWTTRDSYERATGCARRVRFEPTEQEPTSGSRPDRVWRASRHRAPTRPPNEPCGSTWLPTEDDRYRTERASACSRSRSSAYGWDRAAQPGHLSERRRTAATLGNVTLRGLGAVPAPARATLIAA